MRLFCGLGSQFLWGFLLGVLNLSHLAGAADDAPKYMPAFLDAKKDFEKAAVPPEKTLLNTWKCLNHRPIKEAAPSSEIRFLRQDGELRMTLTAADSEGEISFENDGPFIQSALGWSAYLHEDIGLRATIKMDAAGKRLIIENAADKRAKDTADFQNEFKATTDPKSWVMTYSVCTLSE